MSQEKEPWRGKLSTSYSVECWVDNCDSVSHFENRYRSNAKSLAAAQFKKEGWKLTREFGWLCPMHPDGK